MWISPTYINPDIERQRTIFLTGMTPEQIAAENTIRERLILAYGGEAEIIAIDPVTMLGYEMINDDYRIGVKYPLWETGVIGSSTPVDPMDL